MIEENRKLSPDRPVLEQIVRSHKITYKELAGKLSITDRALRDIRAGNSKLKLDMDQIKTLCELLKPFEVRIEDLPSDWILEKKKK